MCSFSTEYNYCCVLSYGELRHLIAHVHTPLTAPILVRVRRCHAPTAILAAQNNSSQKKPTLWLL